MKFSAAAVLAAAAGVSAGSYGYGSNVTYVTEVVESYTTYCPGPTEITHGGKTYTVTEATTLTITDCPCTVTKPVMTTSAVVCHNCPVSSAPPVYTKPTVVAPPPGYTNSTLTPVVPATTAPGYPAPTGTGNLPAPTGSTPTEVPTAGAAKMAAAGLAGIVAIAAFIL